MIEAHNVQVLRASNAFWICGSRFVALPSESCTKWVSCSHLWFRASSAVGRSLGLMVRQYFTKSRAVLETFAQYSSINAKSVSTDRK